MNLEIAEEVEIGAGEGEGWQEHLIQAARMKVPLGGGAKVEDVSLHGGWATLTMPLTYKHNSHEFKKFTAGQIPTE